jgi:hypothetical protein
MSASEESPTLTFKVLDSFPEVGGGQQGIATDRKHVYVQSTTLLVKYDLEGKVLAKSDTLDQHHGGLVYRDGNLYVAVSGCKKEGSDYQRINVYDADTFEKLESHDIADQFSICAGGMAYYDGHYYVAESYWDNDHHDYIVKYDENLNYVETYTVDFKSPYGIQGIEYIPSLGKFLVHSHGDEFYLIEPDFDNASIQLGRAPFKLQDAAWLEDDSIVVNDRAGERVVFVELFGAKK